MSKHFSQPSDIRVGIFWGDEATEQFGIQECDGCGKDFHPDHDNERHGRYGHTTYVCDRCLSLGWPFGRDHKDF